MVIRTELAGSLKGQYGGKDAKVVVSEAFAIRDRLLHGLTPSPSRTEMAAEAEALSCVVGDLIADL